jgi:hypothetical protein
MSSAAMSPEALGEMIVKVRGDYDDLRGDYVDLCGRIKVAQEAGNTSTLDLLLKSETELLKNIGITAKTLGICLQQRASLRACRVCGGRCASRLFVLYDSFCFTPPMKRATTNRGHSRKPLNSILQPNFASADCRCDCIRKYKQWCRQQQ